MESESSKKNMVSEVTEPCKTSSSEPPPPGVEVIISVRDGKKKKTRKKELKRIKERISSVSVTKEHSISTEYTPEILVSTRNLVSEKYKTVLPVVPAPPNTPPCTPYRFPVSTSSSRNLNYSGPPPSNQFLLNNDPPFSRNLIGYPGRVRNQYPQHPFDSRFPPPPIIQAPQFNVPPPQYHDFLKPEQFWHHPAQSPGSHYSANIPPSSYPYAAAYDPLRPSHYAPWSDIHNTPYNSGTFSHGLIKPEYTPGPENRRPSHEYRHSKDAFDAFEDMFFGDSRSRSRKRSDLDSESIEEMLKLERKRIREERRSKAKHRSRSRSRRPTSDRHCSMSSSVSNRYRSSEDIHRPKYSRAVKKSSRNHHHTVSPLKHNVSPQKARQCSPSPRHETSGRPRLRRSRSLSGSRFSHSASSFRASAKDHISPSVEVETERDILLKRWR